MRCANWPDSHCRSPIACNGFGYCRERHWDHHGDPVNPLPHAEQWRKIDDDGKPAGNTYAERGR